MPIQTLIVDDEPLARARLSRLLGQISGVEVVCVCENGQQAVEAFLQLRPELILMDIQMPIKTGIEAAAEILQHAEDPPSIIFCTAYDEYALEAFQLSAAAYLLKPVSMGQLENAVAKAGKLTQLQISTLEAQNTSRPSLVLGNASRSERVYFEDICYFRSEAKNVVVGLSSGTEKVVEQTLTQLEQDYQSILIRLHRSTLVNREKLHRLAKDDDGNEFVELIDSEQRFAVSRRLVSNVRDAFNSIK